MHSHIYMSHKHSFTGTALSYHRTRFCHKLQNFDTKLYLYIYISYTCPICDFLKKTKHTVVQTILTHCLVAVGNIFGWNFSPSRINGNIIYMKAKLLKKTAWFWYAPPLGPGLQVEGKTPHALTCCLPHKPVLPSAASGTYTCSCVTPVSKAIKRDTYCNVVALRASPTQHTGTLAGSGEGNWVHSVSTHHT